MYEPAKQAGIPVIYGKTYDILAAAEAAIVTSGTATLETALFNIPQVVCYRLSPLGYRIAKTVIKVDYIALVNLINNKEAVRELIQSELTVANLTKELKAITRGGDKRDKVLEEYTILREKMGTKKASAETARLIVKSLEDSPAL